MKKITAILLSLVLAASFAACGGDDSRSVGESGVTSSSAPQEASSTQSTSEGETTRTGDTPYFGIEETDYDEYEYLYQEKLQTETTQNKETGKMESREMLAYLPVSDYVYINRNRASSEKLGVDFEVELEPYIDYNQEDYTLNELFDMYAEEEFDISYSSSARHIDIGEKQVSEDGTHIWATADIYSYDSYDSEFTYARKTIVLYEMDNNFYASAMVTVNLEDAVEKTNILLGELTSFYEVDFTFDKEQAQTNLTSYAEENALPEGAFSNSFMTFVLPEGWEDDYGDYVPSDGSNAFISVEREYMGSTDLKQAKALFVSNEGAQEFLESMLNASDESVSVSNLSIAEAKADIGEGFYWTADATDDGISAKISMYVIFGEEGYMYLIYGFATPDASASMNTALEMAFTTAQFN